MPLQQISGTEILDGSVNSVDLANQSVLASKIADGAVGTTQLAAGAVTESILAANSVNSGAIKANAVLNAAIADSQISAAKIENGAVVASKLGANAVTSVAILAGAVTLGKIAVGAVDAAALASDAVTTAKILNLNITGAKIADATITGAKIASGTITNLQLSAGELHYAADVTSLNNKKIIFNYQLDNLTLSAGPSADISAALAGDTPVQSASSSEGVIVDLPKNKCTLRDINFQPITDLAGLEIYGRLTYSTGTWTLSYFKDVAGTPTAHSLLAPLSSAHAMVPKRYNLNLAPEEAFRNAAQFTNNTAALANHITQATGAHMASAIALLDAANHFTTKNVEAALAALAGPNWVEGVDESLKAHITKTTGSHAASSISFAPDGTPPRLRPLTSIEVNAAINEVHAKIEALEESPPAITRGSKYFLSTTGQTVFNISGVLNEPFHPGNNSLQVFVDGILQSADAGHYTEDGAGHYIQMSEGLAANTNVMLVWFK